MSMSIQTTALPGAPERIEHFSKPFGRRLGWVVALTVAENIALPLRPDHKRVARAGIEDAAARVGLRTREGCSASTTSIPGRSRMPAVRRARTIGAHRNQSDGK